MRPGCLGAPTSATLALVSTPLNERPTVRELASLAVPAAIVGVLAGLVLVGINETAHALEHVLWDTLPAAAGIAADSAVWIIGVLTLTGVAVGLVVWLAPGNAGDDPATTHLVEKPQGLKALPGIAIALILGLAGGVSLGPEVPAIAIAVGLAVWVARRIAPKADPTTMILIAAAGILGALFGSAVAAALLLTEMVASLKRGGVLWDRLFAPLVAAATGAATAIFFDSDLALPALPAYELTNPVDLLTGSLVAIGAAIVGLGVAVAMPILHRWLHSLRNPVVYLGIGGLILGLLGVWGGPITLFKGADQSVELVENAGDYTASHLAVLMVAKILALLIASAASFRGGRIFPALFIGIAAGLLVNALFPSIPLTLAVSAATLGFVLAIARDGWLAIFMAGVIAGGGAILGPLCIFVLPVWLLVARAPEMMARKAAEDAPVPSPTL
jgi:H+/Cl- antiporter ClcA